SRAQLLEELTIDIILRLQTEEQSDLVAHYRAGSITQIELRQALGEYVGDSKSAIARVKGRIIGKNGRSRELIEEITETRISVYGGTVAYIGNPEGLEAAREALMKLIKGSFHKTVWNYLYAWRRKMKKDRGELWYESPGQSADLRKR
ncbi:MAG: KH domain-containing protein, partial [bacterium]